MSTTAQPLDSLRPQLSARTLCEAFALTVDERGDAPALRLAGADAGLSWREYGRQVRRVAGGLAALGVRRGDTVALLLTNRPEFNVCDMAAVHLGAAAFSIYNTSAPAQVAHMLANAGSRVVITERSLRDRLDASGSRPDHVVVIDGDDGADLTLDALATLPAPEGFAFETAWRAVEPDDLLTIIYTSGTTGPPKGAELTHASMIAQLRACDGVAPLPTGATGISWLPAAHLADRWATHYTGIAYGMSITCVPDPTQVMAALQETRPTAWGAVPRVWEKLKGALDAARAAEPVAERRAETEAALEAALAVVRAQQRGEPVPADLRATAERADAQHFAPLRALLGLDRAEILCSGGAPTALGVLEFFAAIGLEICELWGMSEAGICTINPPRGARLGSVGRPLPGVEIDLAGDGELLVRSPLTMRGYRADPERTAEALTPDGWLRTGDVATIDGDGYVRIVDRKKDLIISAAGKNMSPANIEAELKAASPLIAHAVCIGDGRPYNVALLVCDPDVARAVSDARAEAADAVERANDRLSRVEQIKRFALLDDEWRPGGPELTPTAKVRRAAVAARYAEVIDGLYARP